MDDSRKIGEDTEEDVYPEVGSESDLYNFVKALVNTCCASKSSSCAY